MKTKIRINSYDLSFDTFAITVTNQFGAVDESLIPAALLPHLIHESGEPDEFIGKEYELTYTPCDPDDAVELEDPKINFRYS